MAIQKHQYGMGLGVGLLTLLFFTWIYGFLAIPTDIHQGDVYKIIFLHVPSACAAFLSAAILGIVSLGYLLGRKDSVVLYGKASAEVGLLFTVITLATGSIWGKPTWGTWWTWDARLTTTLILALLYCGYLLTWASVSSTQLRNKIVSVLGILIVADVPIIYQSVTWWRTLHQPPTLLRAGGASMSGPMLTQLLLCLGLTVILGVWFIVQRARNLDLESQLEEATLNRLQ